MDLFTPIIPEDRWHPHYKHILLEQYNSCREVLNEWASGFQDRDNKFVKEFQSSFNPCFWELYLFAVLKDYGLDVDWSYSSPDFVIDSESGGFCIEATTAGAAQDKLNEWDALKSGIDIKSIDLNELNREAIIRLSNSVNSKYKLFLSQYNQLPQVRNKPFVLAVAPFEQPYFNLQYNRPIRALLYDFYVDEEEHMKHPERYPNGPAGKELGVIFKDNDAPIKLGLFMDDELAGISAIIFSCTATFGKLRALSRNPGIVVFRSVWADGPDGAIIQKAEKGKDYEESLVDGLQIYHNPCARNPLSPKIFRGQGVVQHYFDFGSREWVYEGMESCLMWRHAHTLIPVSKKQKES